MKRVTRQHFARRPRVALSVLSLMAGALLLASCSISIHAVPSAIPSASTPASSPSADPSDASIAASPTASPTVTAAQTASTTPAPTHTPTVPAPTPTPRPTPPPASQGPQPTSPAPTSTPTPQAPIPTVVPTPSGPPQCANVPVRGFGLLWTEETGVAQAIGCSQGSEIGMAAKVQPFENGMMVWLDTESAGVDSSAWVLTLIGSSATRYRVPDNGPAWVDGATEPSGAFAWVWDNVYTLQQVLGDPTGAWYATDGALQRFDRGTMIWLKDVPVAPTPMIYVVGVDLTLASSGTFERYADRSGE